MHSDYFSPYNSLCSLIEYISLGLLKTFEDFHINIIIKRPVQISCYNIHKMHFKIFSDFQPNQVPKGGCIYYRRIFLPIIDPRSLCKTLSYEFGFISYSFSFFLLCFLTNTHLYEFHIFKHEDYGPKIFAYWVKINSALVASFYFGQSCRFWHSIKDFGSRSSFLSMISYANHNKILYLHQYFSSYFSSIFS